MSWLIDGNRLSTPGTLLLVFGIVVVAVAIGYFAGVRPYADAFKAKNEEFVRRASSLGLKTSTYAQRPFAFGEYDGGYMILSPLYVQEGATIASYYLLQAKVPETADMMLYATTKLSGMGSDSKALQQFAGWEKSGEWMLSSAPKRPLEGQAALLGKISAATVASLKSNFPDGVTLMNDFFVTMYGDDVALAVADGDADRAALMDIQIKVSADISDSDLQKTLKALVSAAEELGNELAD